VTRQELAIDWEDVKRAANDPPSDEVTVLRDGRKIDTPSKVREIIAELAAGEFRS
jgi:hypothetical protein